MSEINLSSQNVTSSTLLEETLAAVVEQFEVPSSVYESPEIRKWLVAIRSMLLSISKCNVVASTHNDKFPGLPLRGIANEEASTLYFHPPASVDVVGSFIYRTLVRPSLTIDVVVEMPDDCFVSRDVKNFAYSDKRSMYLGVLYERLLESKLASKVEIEALYHDVLRPVLLLSPLLSDSNDSSTKKSSTPRLSSALSNVRVRLIPVLSSSAPITLEKVLPHRNNVRPWAFTGEAPPSWATDAKLSTLSEEDSLTFYDSLLSGGVTWNTLLDSPSSLSLARSRALMAPPTPEHNDLIAHDLVLLRHHNVISSVLASSEATRNVVVLLKALFRRRGWSRQPDHLSSTAITTLVVHLIQTGVISPDSAIPESTSRAAATLICMRSVLFYLSEKRLSDRSIYVSDSESLDSSKLQSYFKLYKHFGACAMLTPGRTSLTARVSAGAVTELLAFARLCTLMLGSPHDCERARSLLSITLSSYQSGPQMLTAVVAQGKDRLRAEAELLGLLAPAVDPNAPLSEDENDDDEVPVVASDEDEDASRKPRKPQLSRQALADKKRLQELHRLRTQQSEAVERLFGEIVPPALQYDRLLTVPAPADALLVSHAYATASTVTEAARRGERRSISVFPSEIDAFLKSSAPSGYSTISEKKKGKTSTVEQPPLVLHPILTATLCSRGDGVAAAAHLLPTTLAEALTDRVEFVRVVPRYTALVDTELDKETDEWLLKERLLWSADIVPPRISALTIILSLGSPLASSADTLATRYAASARHIELGPSSSSLPGAGPGAGAVPATLDVDEALKFRNMWGSRVHLRRFADGDVRLAVLVAGQDEDAATGRTLEHIKNMRNLNSHGFSAGGARSRVYPALIVADVLTRHFGVSAGRQHLPPGAAIIVDTIVSRNSVNSAVDANGDYVLDIAGNGHALALPKPVASSWATLTQFSDSAASEVDDDEETPLYRNTVKALQSELEAAIFSSDVTALSQSLLLEQSLDPSPSVGPGTVRLCVSPAVSGVPHSLRSFFLAEANNGDADADTDEHKYNRIPGTIPSSTVLTQLRRGLIDGVTQSPISGLIVSSAASTAVSAVRKVQPQPLALSDGTLTPVPSPLPSNLPTAGGGSSDILPLLAPPAISGGHTDTIKSFQSAIEAFDWLALQLRKVPRLPFGVKSTVALAPELRFTALAPPSASPLLSGSGVASALDVSKAEDGLDALLGGSSSARTAVSQKTLMDAAVAAHTTTLASLRALHSTSSTHSSLFSQLSSRLESLGPTAVQTPTPLPILITLEHSTQWPEDADAIAALKSAFFAKIRSGLLSMHRDVLSAHVRSGWIDIHCSGFLFRAFLDVPAEEAALVHTLRGSVPGLAAAAASAPNLTAVSNLIKDSDLPSMEDISSGLFEAIDDSAVRSGAGEGVEQGRKKARTGEHLQGTQESALFIPTEFSVTPLTGFVNSSGLNSTRHEGFTKKAHRLAVAKKTGFNVVEQVSRDKVSEMVASTFDLAPAVGKRARELAARLAVHRYLTKQLPAHAAKIAYLHSNVPAFSGTVRLLGFWLRANRFGGSFGVTSSAANFANFASNSASSDATSDGTTAAYVAPSAKSLVLASGASTSTSGALIKHENIELIVAYIFLHSAPLLPPSSPFLGLLRALHLLHTFPWQTKPLIVDFSQIDESRRRAMAVTRFSKLRSIDEQVQLVNALFQRERARPSGGEGMFIVSIGAKAPTGPDFRGGSPLPVLIPRLVKLAKSSFTSLSAVTSNFPEVPTAQFFGPTLRFPTLERGVHSFKYLSGIQNVASNPSLAPLLITPDYSTPKGAFSIRIQMKNPPPRMGTLDGRSGGPIAVSESSLIRLANHSSSLSRKFMDSVTTSLGLGGQSEDQLQSGLVFPLVIDEDSKKNLNANNDSIISTTMIPPVLMLDMSPYQLQIFRNLLTKAKESILPGFDPRFRLLEELNHLFSADSVNALRNHGGALFFPAMDGISVLWVKTDERKEAEAKKKGKESHSAVGFSVGLPRTADGMTFAMDFVSSAASNGSGVIGNIDM